MATVETSFPIDQPLPRRVELHNGDHMTADEFHAIYEQMPEDFCAELIGGIVYVMMSPLGKRHGRGHSYLNGVLLHYEGGTAGVECGDNTTVRLSPTSEPQPDLYLRVIEECGGRSTTSEDGDSIIGPPELIAEVARSSRAVDLGRKKADYAAAGVLEYLVLTLDDEPALRWFDLSANAERAPDADGVVRVQTFPGLWINVRALLEKNYKPLLATLEAGLASPEHAAFVEQLAGRRASS